MMHTTISILNELFAVTGPALQIAQDNGIVKPNSKTAGYVALAAILAGAITAGMQKKNQAATVPGPAGPAGPAGATGAAA